MIRDFLKYFKDYKLHAILAPLFKLLEACFELLVPIIVSNIIEQGIKQNNSEIITQDFLILISFSIIGIICALTAQYFSSKCAVRVSTLLRRDLFRKYQSLSLEAQAEITTSKIINLTNSDINNIQTAINLFLRLFLRAPIIVFGSLIMALTINFKISIIFLSIIPLLIILVYIIMTKSVPLYTKTSSIKDEINKKTSDNLTGFRVIRSFNKQEDEKREFNEVNNRLYRNEIKATNFTILLSPFTLLIIDLGIIAIIWLSGIEVNIGALSQGETIALYNYMSNILVEIIKLTNLFITITKGIASYKRINLVLNKTSKMDYVDMDDLNEKTNDTIISLNNVSYSYGENSKNVLESITFNIKKGETVGIIGGTGSGKSTLLSLITRLNDVTTGEVLIDNTDVKKYTKESLESKISIVLQKPELFQGTIRENITFGKCFSEEKIEKATRLSEAYNFINKKENRLDYILTKNATNLSGGEKQRLSIARGLIKNSEILILDDSFSSLDYITDKTIRQNIKASCNYKAVIITTQRISSIISCDKIIVLNDGKIEAIGKHEDLINSSTTYKKIYDLQYNN